MKLQQILPNVFRIERPETAVDFGDLRAQGIATIVSLESGVADFVFGDELVQEEKHGVKLIRLRWCPVFPPGAEAIKHARDLVKTLAAEGAVGFHCFSSVDRTGILALALRILDCGWTWDSALAEMRVMGFHWRFLWWIPLVKRALGVR